MNAPLRMLLVAGLSCAALLARNDITLPTWDEAERKELEKSGWVPGAPLLADESGPEAPPQPEPLPPDLERPTAVELAPDQSSAVPEKYLAAYFGTRPETYLIDPQGLLDRRSASDRQTFLKDHADDSTIDLFIYLFDKGQELQGEARAEELTERFFAEDRPALVVLYYLGAPQQTVLYLSPSLMDGVSAAEQRRALQSAVMQAADKADPQEQLEAFTVQMAMRSYWMERLLGGDEAAPEGLPGTPSRKSKVAKPTSSLTEKWATLRPVAEDLALPGMALAGAIGLAAGLGAWLRWRAKYRFPEVAVEPRLGGDHAAGVGAVISFSSAALPPAAQRARLADPFRRF